MKVLYVSTISNTINSFLIQHIKLLVEQGHHVDVAFNKVQEVSPELIKLGCKIHNIEFQRSPLQKSNITAYKKIRKLILDEGYELIHTHTPIASFLTRLVCRKIPNLKIIYTAHGFHFFKGAPLKNWLVFYPMERLAAKYTDAIITINQEDYETAQNLKLKKLNSVYKIHGVGIDLDKFSFKGITEKINLRKEYGYKIDDFILFYAAELNHNKHQDLLISVVNRLKDKIPNIKLLLAGEGPLSEKYKEQVNMLGLRDNIHFLGYRKDIPNLLKLSDIAVAASRREGLPVNVMEAMATGLPLVVTNCRGQRDLVIDGENGFIVGIEDERGFIDAINNLYDSQSLREVFSKRSLDLIKQFSLEGVLEEIKNIYSSLGIKFRKVGD